MVFVLWVQSKTEQWVQYSNYKQCFNRFPFSAFFPFYFLIVNKMYTECVIEKEIIQFRRWILAIFCGIMGCVVYSSLVYLLIFWHFQITSWWIMLLWIYQICIYFITWFNRLMMFLVRDEIFEFPESQEKMTFIILWYKTNYCI